MLQRKHRISKRKINLMLKEFVYQSTAKRAAMRIGVSRNCANRYFNHFRECIADEYRRAPRLGGEVEMDQSFFGKGVKRQKFDDKVARNRSAYGDDWRPKGDPLHWSKRSKRRRESRHVMVFGILQRGGEVYTRIIERADRKTLFPIIHMVVPAGSTIYTDSWQGFNGLKIDGYTHKPVNHALGPVGRDGAHTGGIDSFWGIAKGLLMRFRGISRRTFALHIKECEWRWNIRNEEEMLKILKKIT